MAFFYKKFSILFDSYLDFRHIFDLRIFRGVPSCVDLFAYSILKHISDECSPYLKIFPKKYTFVL